MDTADDKSGLLTSLEMAEKKKSDTNKSFYFEDGVRQIDYILAYEIGNCDVKNEHTDEHRKTYLNHLQEKGLILEKGDPRKTEVHILLFF